MQTAAELRASLRRAVIAVDPDGAERRRKAAVRGRRVTRYQRDDGTSAIEAVLSAIDTGEIYDLVDEVARRTKTSEDTRSMDARRADALVWLVLGRDPQLGPEDLPPPSGHGTDRSPSGPSNPPASGPDDPATRPSDPPPDGPTVPPTEDIGDDHRGWSEWLDAGEVARRDAELSLLDVARETRAARLSELGALALSAMIARRPHRSRWVGVNGVHGPNGAAVRVGELEGYGPITSEAADHLLASGAAQRPDPPSGREPTAEQAARHDPPEWLDRETRDRDGTCRFPGCRQSSRRSGVDHTIRFPEGLTVPSNLGALCRRHHRIKHCGTWRVGQDGSHRYTWTSTITGRSYVTYPRGTTGDWKGAMTVVPTMRGDSVSDACEFHGVAAGSGPSWPQDLGQVEPPVRSGT